MYISSFNGRVKSVCTEGSVAPRELATPGLAISNRSLDPPLSLLRLNINVRRRELIFFFHRNGDEIPRSLPDRASNKYVDA